MNLRLAGMIPEKGIFFYKAPMNRVTPYLLACLLLHVLSTLSLRGQDNHSLNDWPQWRGPDRSGTWYNGPEVDTLTQDMVSRVWDVSLGSGYCGPTVAEGRVYVTDLVEGSERVICLNAQNGKTEWIHSYPVTYSVGYPTGPRASVLINSGKAYSWGTMGHLHCLNAKTGEVLWKINTAEKYFSRIPTWGMASNLILVDKLLVVQAGGTDGACLLAFHKNTGEEIWRALDDEASYSTPRLSSQAGKRVLVYWTGGSITGLNPKNGAIHWSIPLEPVKMIMNVANPVYDPPFLFLSAFFDGSYLIELDQQTTSAKVAYHRHGPNERNTDALHCCISTPIIQEAYVYGIDSYGETRCLELKTGKRIWEDLTLVPPERWANVHLVRQGKKVWGFNETGELLLGRFSPEAYHDLGRIKVIDPVRISPNPRNGVNWAHPAFSGNHIYVRSDSRLVCLRIEVR